MKISTVAAIALGVSISLLSPRAFAEEAIAFKKLFNGKDLSGWVNVNTKKDTWKVSKEGLLVCSGHPIGVMRSDKQYENFILKIVWRHMEPGGNSGMFIWSDAVPLKQRLPDGLEVQMLDVEYAPLHNRTIDYVHGELFPVGDVTAIPDNPRGRRSKAAERRCKGKQQWNEYIAVCVDGTVKLSVNGKFVNGIQKVSQKKGYLCLESEGAEVHFKTIEIMELPPGITSKEQTSPKLPGKTILE